ncbi:DUF6602 domain-containing protein [Curtobacterium flaccumfaciens]|uniref:DUF6602 domain-containing protein n=1 Tax=Curtobacterium flaccumfaciens TaxID=2035 RepID=UPI001BDEB28F|nr:DUF6602 domain-containing protein [Curtobacterium flaccumfaciens]MBT1631301.1 hypothetical protein [Curtobacterium flaccumfaciens pv. oortii]MCS5521488.1 hypothetical protein [Curtobacterium flaccumfaciens pv. oortii]MCX2844578.1 hypothetical protein [Curtobacterium flaccumfaciens pv. oortii]
MTENRFQGLIRRVADQVQADYEEARQHARDHNPQRSGHEGEATWIRLLSEWGPACPVVSRKYIVGPGGDSNEVDLLVLKPDYPKHLIDDPSILASGVAAAFSVKLTLRRRHLTEALMQKRRLLEVAGASPGSVREALCGPFPFGILAHSSELARNATDFRAAIQELHEQTAYGSTHPLVRAPREELDALLIADRAFFSARRASLVPAGLPGTAASWQPMSSFNSYHGAATNLPGAPLAQFVTWLSQTLLPVGASPLGALEAMFGADASSGNATLWPRSIYPAAMLERGSMLLNDYGNPLLF